LPTAALEEELASGKRDNVLTLHGVKPLFSHHPGVYGDGAGSHALHISNRYIPI
jgi:hypothetical protein